MNINFLIEMLFNVIRGFLFDSKKAAPYAKWLIRIRDYLNLLFPVALYPKFSTEDAALKAVPNVIPVPVAAVKEAGEKHGFSLSNIFGG